MNKHTDVFKKLYSDVNGYQISLEGRRHNSAKEYTYGEIEFEPFIELLSNYNVNPETVFYDLGSGTGKAVIACAMAFDVAKSCGIELLTPLHKAALLQKERLAKLPNYKAKIDRIVLKHGDLRKADIQDADLIFINSTTFGNIWPTVCEHVEQVKPGTIVITLTRSLISEQFELLLQDSLKMSWGKVTLFVHKKNSHTSSKF